MAGQWICVRMTDGISFSLSSHRHSNKGLIEGEEAPKKRGERQWEQKAHGGRFAAGAERGNVSCM